MFSWFRPDIVCFAETSPDRFRVVARARLSLDALFLFFVLPRAAREDGADGVW